uniref:Dynein axonemal heavy chain 8 n=1 Tax=Anser cygnoides TaxID=8845 RepID=A0A8B9E3F0_ANSCY
MEGVQEGNNENSDTGEVAGPHPEAAKSTGHNLTVEDSLPVPAAPEDAGARPARQMAAFSPSQETFSAASRKLSRFCRSSSGVLSLQEALKEKQARYKEAREYRRTKIDASYKYVFEVLSVRLGLDVTTVEEMILDSPSLEAFDSFFAKGGSKALKIFYQEGDVPGIECGRTFPGVVKGSKMLQLYVDNTPDKFVGLCLFFVRFKNDSPINAKTIHEDIFFCVLDATEGLLHGVRNMIEKVFLPAILATNNWGVLSQTKQDTKDKQNFVETINRYLSFLEGAIISIEGTVQLKQVDHINFSKLQSFEEVTAAADNPDMVHQLEEVLMIWYRQIERVLIESQQMRKEADNSGPLTELEHWKCMSAKFNFLIEQIKGPNCKAVVNILNVAHSKLLKMWQELDARITDAANESKDNVKYLYTLEKVCQPLYNYDLESMTRGIPNLINAIRMIHSVSRYYNTSERMTSLFIKVTNQMVTTCRAYITDGGFSLVWEQKIPIVIGKIKVCVSVFFSMLRVLLLTSLW